MTEAAASLHAMAMFRGFAHGDGSARGGVREDAFVA
jgi:hypothetical protein